ncbi:hypothetical protein [Myxococcus sp. Y35]|uniref:hypothetical protein n=1 Tax=Pseudomyxococcus flavus TaxID=3115648 RepID=UPI003CF9899D
MLDALGIPPAFDDPKLTKAEYIESRFALVTDRDLAPIAGNFLRLHARTFVTVDWFELEELCWVATPTITISKRTRYQLAKALEGAGLYLRASPFLDLVQRLWERETVFGGIFGQAEGTLSAQVRQHIIRNPNVTVR